MTLALLPQFNAARFPQPPQRLLIRCLRSAPPSQPLPELLQGFDTATQITALAQWLRHHTARAVLSA